LLEAAKQKGRAYHKSSNHNALTKSELRELVTSQDNSIKEMTSFGADIPTTPMFWKKQINRLQWIVRQMSWSPPWVADTEEDLTRAKFEDRRQSHIDKVLHRCSQQIPQAAASSHASTLAPSTDMPTTAKDHVPLPKDVELPAQAAAPQSAARPDQDVESCYKRLWVSCPQLGTVDTYGYGRSPAFWFTLNCPYNYLHEIHRFQDDRLCLDAISRASKDMRFRWSLDNPDIVCQLHVIRVELIIRMVMPAVVPPTRKFPFQ